MSRKKSTPEEMLQTWAAEQHAEDRDRAEQEQGRTRSTELERAFIAVRGGMPDTGDDEADALAFAKRLGCLGRLAEDNPCLVHCPPDQIEAEDGSPKAYAVTVLMEAVKGNEVKAAGMLSDSWRASKRKHDDVLYWLTSGLEAVIMGRDRQAARETAVESPQSPTLAARPAEGASGREGEGGLETARASEAQGSDLPASSAAPPALPEPPPADGPLADDCFACGGASHRIPHLQWLLLKTLWNKRKGVGTERVLKAVYGEDDGEGRLKSLAHDLKATLKRLKIPYAPSCRSEKWRLRRTDASPAA
jgi:hypothetical protein